MLDNKLSILTQQKYCLSTARLPTTNNRIALLLPIGSDVCLKSITLLHSNFELLFDSDMPYSKAKTTDKNTDTQITDPELFIQQTSTPTE